MYGVATAVLWAFIVGGIAGYNTQNGSAKDEKAGPPIVTISKADAEAFKDAAAIVEKGQLTIRALSAEIQLAQRQLKELQEQLEKERQKTDGLLTEMCKKAGIPREKLGDYDLTDDAGGFRLVRKKKE
jgi:hypothetical protein